jgi:hypothetical protein
MPAWYMPSSGGPASPFISATSAQKASSSLMYISRMAVTNPMPCTYPTCSTKGPRQGEPV